MANADSSAAEWPKSGKVLFVPIRLILKKCVGVTKKTWDTTLMDIEALVYPTPNK